MVSGVRRAAMAAGIGNLQLVRAQRNRDVVGQRVGLLGEHGGRRRSGGHADEVGR